MSADPGGAEARVGVRRRRARANGITLHYAVAGDGPPVALLHGFPFTWFSWRHVIPALAANRTVVAPDLRGYGRSDKPRDGYDKRTMANDIVALMRGLGHERFDVVGHDRGARVATRLAKDHPDRVRSLVAVDNIPTLHVADRMDARLAQAYWIFLFNAVPDVPERLLQGRERFWMRYFIETWSYDPAYLEPEAFEVYVAALEAPGGIRGGLSDYRAAPEDVAQDRADRDTPIAAPVLAVWGAEFPLVGGMFDVAGVWRAFARTVEAAPIPHAGHMPHEENPVAFTARLLDFLDRVAR
jgi:pimeloyl-ACP methyl ester carboxylesterase